MVKYTAECDLTTKAWRIVEWYRATANEDWTCTDIDLGTDREDAESLAAAYAYIEKYEQAYGQQ
jgi:hypothetical protein